VLQYPVEAKMRIPVAALILSEIFTSGCSTLISVSPFVTDQYATMDPSLLGVWRDSDYEIFITRRSQTSYTVVYSGDTAAVKFEGRVLALPDAEILDLASTSDDAFMLPAHLLVRVWSTGSTLQWAFLDTPWIKDLAIHELTTQAAGDRSVITSPGDVVKGFLVRHSGDDRAHGSTNILQRVN
jgi:hypothetical protein